MALRGLKVVEMAGLAPGPFAGMILAGESIEQTITMYAEFVICSVCLWPLLIFPDFGASVVRVDKPNQPPLDTLARCVYMTQ